MMEILSDKKNSLLKRREIEGKVESDGNPGFAVVAKMLADELKVGEDVIVVTGVNGRFGRNEFFIETLVYDSVEDKERIEPRKKEVKKTGGSS